jgi:hypothetical protein
MLVSGWHCGGHRNQICQCLNAADLAMYLIVCTHALLNVIRTTVMFCEYPYTEAIFVSLTLIKSVVQCIMDYVLSKCGG